MNDPTIKRHNEIIKGYKAVKIEGKKYYTDGMGSGKKTYIKPGDILEIPGKPELCNNGVHFFRHLCFAIDFLEKGNVIFEIETLGEEIIEDPFKLVTCKIKILRKISKKEILVKTDKKNNSGDGNSGDGNSGDRNSGDRNSGNRNSGDGNSGYGNSGDRNSGYWNSGYRNSGDRNSGYRNSGDGNSGYWNSGYWNSGDRNSGYGNSGYWNSGDRNSGDGNSGYRNSGNWNSGDGNSGYFNSCDGYHNYFCTETKYFLFDILCKKETIDKINAFNFLWFNLEGKGIKGYKKAWSKCPQEILDKFRTIKEFQTKSAKEKFKEITGLNL